MRRRAADHRRPVRRRVSNWIWILLVMFFFGGLCLFVVHQNHDHDLAAQPILEKDEIVKTVHHCVNVTDQSLNTISIARQLADKMTVAKAYVIIAKEHNHLQLAWELSSNIRSCQLLLSKAAMRGEPISFNEAEPTLKSLASLIFKAEDAHYDITTTIMTMKSHIQALEERARAAAAQSSLFAQMAVEALPVRKIQKMLAKTLQPGIQTISGVEACDHYP